MSTLEERLAALHAEQPLQHIALPPHGEGEEQRVAWMASEASQPFRRLLAAVYKAAGIADGEEVALQVTSAKDLSPGSRSMVVAVPHSEYEARPPACGWSMRCAARAPSNCE